MARFIPSTDCSMTNLFSSTVLLMVVYSSRVGSFPAGNIIYISSATPQKANTLTSLHLWQQVSECAQVRLLPIKQQAASGCLLAQAALAARQAAPALSTISPFLAKFAKTVQAHTREDKISCTGRQTAGLPHL